MMRRIAVILGGLVVLGIAAFLLLRSGGPQPGQVQDEAMRAGRTAVSFSAAADRYFDAIDNGVKLNDDETKGRNMWLVWTGGNDRFWEGLIKNGFGVFDLPKVISSPPALPVSRKSRWAHFGISNEPCLDQPAGPDPQPFGL